MVRVLKASLVVVLVSLFTFSSVQADSSVDAEWSSLAWYQIPGKYKKHWRKLGWTENIWDSGNEAKFPASNGKAWHELSDVEQGAAWALGYDEACWNGLNK